MPKKDKLATFRVTNREINAMRRFAKYLGLKTTSDLFRKNVVNPSMQHDPKQRQFPLYDHTLTKP